MADIHLGNRQYGSEERQMDFAQAFLDAIRFSVKKEVDFILISGDLFHKKTEMDPVTLLQARKVLEIPERAGIPVIAVEGNHDSTYFRENYSWMDYLASSGLLINLKPEFSDGVVLREWDGENGAYFEIDGTRIYGMKYYGSLTEKVLDEYVRKIKSSDFTIFMAHIGVEGYVKNMYGCIPSAKLHKLRGKVDYIALGHLHRAFVEGNLVFNPGSLESCDISETQYERGIYFVEVDDRVEFSLVNSFYTPRDFVILDYSMKSPDLNEFESFIRAKRAEVGEKNKPVVDLKIEVERAVRSAISEENLRKIISDFFDPLLVRIHWEVRNIFKPSLPDLESKESIERSVISQLLENYSYGDISDEVLNFKRIFSSSFNLVEVDKMVEDVLTHRTRKEAVKPGEYSESQVSEKLEKSKKSDAEAEKKKDFEDVEEEWDWRSALDSAGRTRKHKKL
jgi:DNA repair exonuclease SbcCD nuclease subunit